MIDDDLWPDPADDFDSENESVPEKDDDTPSATRALAEELLKRAIGDNAITEIAERQGFCLVVATGADGLVNPTERLLDGMGDWSFTVARTAEKARKDGGFTRLSVIGSLTEGGRVLGIAATFEALPDVVLSAADMRVTLPAISPDIVAAAVEKMSGAAVAVPPSVSRLGFDDVVLCLRRGASGEECVARLERAAARARSITPVPDDVPLIEDLHGYGDAKTWAIELVADLEAWRKGEIEFAAIDRAVVLASPPGLGKSTFVRSLSRSTRLPLVATSVGAWFSDSTGHLGAVIQEIDKIFRTASAAAPAILMLDEIDAAPSRASLDSHNADWWTTVVTHLLTLLDSAVSGATDQLIVIGATNHPEKLDPALVRPGRLNRVIHIGLPDAAALEGILRQHLGTDLAGEDLTEAATLAVGGTGANAVAWVRRARRTARAAGRPMAVADLVAAIAPVDSRPAGVVERVAVHEAGHAAIAHLLGTGQVRFVSIVQRGNTGGATAVDPAEGITMRGDVERAVMQSLGGRAAEQVLLGEPGTGAGGINDSDLANATRMLGLLHLGLGFGEQLSFRGDAEAVFSILAIDPRTAAAVEGDLQRLYSKTLDLMRGNADLVRAVADTLLARRHLDADAFLEVVGRHRAGTQEKEQFNG